MTNGSCSRAGATLCRNHGLACCRHWSQHPSSSLCHGATLLKYRTLTSHSAFSPSIQIPQSFLGLRLVKSREVTTSDVLFIKSGSVCFQEVWVHLSDHLRKAVTKRANKSNHGFIDLSPPLLHRGCPYLSPLP